MAGHTCTRTVAHTAVFRWRPDQSLDDSGSLLQCATHGALFLIESGECVAGPCAGQTLRQLDAVEDKDSIWLQTDR